MIVIGLAGNIGSGKSLAAHYLRQKGAAVVDADKISREIVRPQQPAWHKIVSAFGQAYLLPDGNINRKMLGEKVFGEPKSRLLLNQITHPYIREEAQKQIEAHKKAGVTIIVLEAAILLECSFRDLVDEIWLIVADRDFIKERLKKRDGFSEKETEKRLSSQMSPQEQMRLADRIIYNEGTEADLRQKINDLYDQYEKRYEKG
jgi:dephospho-CoA kinase